MRWLNQWLILIINWLRVNTQGIHIMLNWAISNIQGSSLRLSANWLSKWVDFFSSSAYHQSLLEHPTAIVTCLRGEVSLSYTFFSPSNTPFYIWHLHFVITLPFYNTFTVANEYSSPLLFDWVCHRIWTTWLIKHNNGI